MTPEDFFDDDFFSDQRVLHSELLERVRAGTYSDRSDVEVAVALLRLAHDELEAYGTDDAQRTDEQGIRLILRTSRQLLKRLGIILELPFSDYRTFRTHWVANDARGSWQARRDILNEFFEPVHLELAQLEDDELGSVLARPITSHPGTGWNRVDTEINELRRHFHAARSAQDYRNVGNDCVAVLERLSEVVFDPEAHLAEGEQVPPVANTKVRLGKFVERAAPGSANAEIRKVARAAIELAQAIKHQGEPTRRNAGIAADSVILLANILRRLAEE
ncbi:hypothetical protein [Candidatus Poriferisodalis sp.]|uniref:hypothetical protein n=1 Tax=Candidatus Poriferisodalis sp. TaxID=3101277 RepID=UPI003D0E9E71